MGREGKGKGGDMKSKEEREKGGKEAKATGVAPAPGSASELHVSSVSRELSVLQFSPAVSSVVI